MSLTPRFAEPAPQPPGPIAPSGVPTYLLNHAQDDRRLPMLLYLLPYLQATGNTYVLLVSR